MFEIDTFYKFVSLQGLGRIRSCLMSAMREHSIKGTVIIAEEGFNATVCGRPDSVKSFLIAMQEIFGCSVEPKRSYHYKSPFRKGEVKVKREIVTLKKAVDLSLGEGTHVSPDAWNRIISQGETVVLDVRNDYEARTGSFAGAVNPGTEKFSELPAFVDNNLDPALHPSIAIYCTGGIRCEKFAPFLIARGFRNVVQLDGGILRYLSEVEPDASLWKGECFVFDERVAINERLEKGHSADLSQTSADDGEKP